MGFSWEPTNGPEAKKLAEAPWHALMAQMGSDALSFESLKVKVPDEWWTLEMDFECAAPEEKVTLYVDRAVARMFRTMEHRIRRGSTGSLGLRLQMQFAAPWHKEKDIVYWAMKASEKKRREELEPGKMAEHEVRLMEDLAWPKDYEAGQKAASSDPPALGPPICAGATGPRANFRGARLRPARYSPPTRGRHGRLRRRKSPSGRRRGS